MSLNLKLSKEFLKFCNLKLLDPGAPLTYFNDWESDRGSYFIPVQKKIQTSKFVYPKKSPPLFSNPRKSLRSFFMTQKNPSVFSVTQKYQGVFHRPKNLFWSKFQTPKI